ncbi:TIGR01777 family oxidoreductase [Persicitalea jodogahamensis]|uniref:NAD-dependent epimerase n=1 Tax=Persicitalea jodogahamensis TaxID=402147 RepID=A0A8J3DCY4_9BACT|nr:TIGR01777 family oxidoreductase [Persicitalea jodogahamensis]GHB85237.1 NAD-dependent epimerase [Persicitalea jodogahamensis]
MKKNVLITGGTGLIGRRLTEMLLERGYLVSYLSRSEKTYPDVSVYHWDIEKEAVDPRALDSMDYLIHLAGAGIADERWTDERKKVIVKSRTESIELLARIMKAQGQRPKAFVSSSAVGYYGADTGGVKHTEQSPPGDDFLAEVTVKWEASADHVKDLGVRTVKLRTGVVLSDKSGALPKIAAPARFGLGAPLGDGDQWMSWIHIDDMCRLYIEALENESWEGVYNGVASPPVTNAELTKLISQVLHRPQWIPKVPEFALDLAFGEMAEVVLGSSYVENARLRTTDFKYEFPDLEGTLQDLLLKKA